MTRNETILLYLGIMGISIILAFGSQRRKNDINNTEIAKFHLLPYLLSLIIPWFFLSFSKIGVDYNNYYKIVSRVDWNHLTIGTDVEPLFNLLCVILKTITQGNIHAVLFLMKTLTVLLVGASIYIIRDRVRVGYSIMGYLFLMYLASFYLLSICLASSIVMIAVSIWRKKEKIIVPLLLIILAGLLHNSVLILFPSFVLCVVFRKSYGRTINCLIILGYLAITFMSSSIYNYASSYIGWFHYKNYQGAQSNGSGLMMILRYLPLFFIWYALIKKVSDQQLTKNVLIFILSSCMFFALGYRFAVIGRMEYNLLFLYCLLLPEMFVKSDGMFRKSFSVFQPYQLIALGYYLMRGYFEFTSRTGALSTIINYEFFNPFI